MRDKIDEAVFKGIKKTINRFRENPFYYFTEADIHTSLHNDIVSGKSNIMYQPINNNFRVSLVHQEYPTCFRYKKKDFGNNYYRDNIGLTDPECKYGDRGNYDLVVLDPDFTNLDSDSIIIQLKDVINKDILTNSYKKIKPLFFIEVKFLHLFNYRHKNMIDEVKNDNEKLELALHYTQNAKAMNLVFCYAEKSDTNRVIEDIRKYITEYCNSVNNNVANIFIQSYIDSKENANIGKKITVKPESNKNIGPEWISKILS